MAQSGSFKHRLGREKARSDQLEQEGNAAGMPAGPRSLYRMNDDEFMHHVSILTMEKLILEKLGITPEEWELRITETWNDELARLIAAWKNHKSEQLRERLTQGIIVNPDIDV